MAINTASVVFIGVVAVLPARWGGPVLGVGGVAGRVVVDTMGLVVSRTIL